jgi:hypothetical protein
MASAEQPHEEVVPPLHEPDRQLLLHAEVLLGGPPGAGALRAGLDPEVAPVDQALEVVPGHVGVEREGEGHLGGRHAGLGPDVQEDVAAGRVAEGGGDGGHGGAEAPVVGVVPGLGDLWLPGDRGGAHGG